MTPITPGARGPGVGTNPAYLRVIASLQNLKGEQGASQDLRLAVQGGRANGAQGAAGAFPSGRYFTVAGPGAFGLAALVMLLARARAGSVLSPGARRAEGVRREDAGRIRAPVGRGGAARPAQRTREWQHQPGAAVRRAVRDQAPQPNGCSARRKTNASAGGSSLSSRRKWPRSARWQRRASDQPAVHVLAAAHRGAGAAKGGLRECNA